VTDLGLVLAGGAARGAYQAGVLRFVFVELADRLGRPTWPRFVSGTSVGAINGLYAASQSRMGLRRLARMWRQMRIEHIYHLRWQNLIAAIRSAYSADQQFALLDPAPLFELITHRFPRGQLRQAIDSGRCRALVVSATELDAGLNVLFVDSAMDELGIDASARARVCRVKMNAQHVLASAALPFIFPAVEVMGSLHVDGGLRQSTPLRPLLRMGVERALVIGVKQARSPQPSAADVTPNLPFLLGKTLNAAMLDPLERDLEGARRVNRIIEWGEARHGPGFRDGLREDLGVRRAEVLVMSPSEDLGAMATEVFRASPPKVPRKLMWLLSFVADRANAVESDLLSYLLFDQSYTAALERLGFEDARAREEELARLVGAGVDVG